MRVDAVTDRERELLAAVHDSLPEPYRTLRLPTTTNQWHADWAYLVAVVLPDPDRTYLPFIDPADDELALIGRYLDHRRNEVFANPDQILSSRPLDVGDAVNTILLAKRRDGGWCYRRATHETGMWPIFGDTDRNPMALADLLAFIEGDGQAGDRWRARRTPTAGPGR